MGCPFYLSVPVSLYTLVNPLEIRTKMSSIDCPLHLVRFRCFSVTELPSSNVLGPT